MTDLYTAVGKDKTEGRGAQATKWSLLVQLQSPKAGTGNTSPDMSGGESFSLMADEYKKAIAGFTAPGLVAAGCHRCLHNLGYAACGNQGPGPAVGGLFVRRGPRFLVRISDY
jgi:hypothetical protein